MNSRARRFSKHSQIFLGVGVGETVDLDKQVLRKNIEWMGRFSTKFHKM